MSDKSTGRELVDDIALGVVSWGGGAALFGAVEAMTNTAMGLFQPLGTWLFTVGVYLILGALAGLGGGLMAFVWQRIPFLPRMSAGPFLAAVFLGGLFFVFVGLPLNDRVLPDTLSVPGLLGNAVFGLVLVVVARSCLRACAARTARLILPGLAV